MQEEKIPLKEDDFKTIVKEDTSGAKKLRQIIIETDGNVIKLVKAEVAGNLELSAIMRAVLSNLER